MGLDTAGWMTAMHDSLAKQRFDRVLFPGSHDSGASTQVKYNFLMIPSPVLRAFSATQHLTPIQQFLVGVRYFDCRIRGGYFCHGVVSTNEHLLSFLKKLVIMLKKSELKRELVILNFKDLDTRSPSAHEIYSALSSVIVRSSLVPRLKSSKIGDLLEHGNVICVAKEGDKRFFDCADFQQGYVSYSRSCLVIKPSTDTHCDIVRYLECQTTRPCPKIQISQAHVQYKMLVFLKLFMIGVFSIESDYNRKAINRVALDWLMKNPLSQINIFQLNFIPASIWRAAISVNLKRCKK